LACVARNTRRVASARSFGAQQHGVLISGGIGGVAKDLAGIVDCHGVRNREAGTSGNLRVQIDQAVRELALLRRAFKLGTVSGKVGLSQVPDFAKLIRQGFWEHSEYEKFRDALPVYERPMFVFGYWTGCRFGEISQLEWSQVDFDGRAVRLRNDQTKAKEPRVIRSVVFADLAHMGVTAGSLFPGLDGACEG
jgi:integrase